MIQIESGKHCQLFPATQTSTQNFNKTVNSNILIKTRKLSTGWMLCWFCRNEMNCCHSPWSVHLFSSLFSIYDDNYFNLNGHYSQEKDVLLAQNVINDETMKTEMLYCLSVWERLLVGVFVWVLLCVNKQWQRLWIASGWCLRRRRNATAIESNAKYQFLSGLMSRKLLARFVHLRVHFVLVIFLISKRYLSLRECCMRQYPFLFTIPFASRAPFTNFIQNIPRPWHTWCFHPFPCQSDIDIFYLMILLKHFRTNIEVASRWLKWCCHSIVSFHKF